METSGSEVMIIWPTSGHLPWMNRLAVTLSWMHPLSVSTWKGAVVRAFPMKPPSDIRGKSTIREQGFLPEIITIWLNRKSDTAGCPRRVPPCCGTLFRWKGKPSGMHRRISLKQWSWERCGRPPQNQEPLLRSEERRVGKGGTAGE